MIARRGAKPPSDAFPQIRIAPAKPALDQTETGYGESGGSGFAEGEAGRSRGDVHLRAREVHGAARAPEGQRRSKQAGEGVDRRRGEPDPRDHRARAQGRRRPAPRRLDEREAPDGHRRLSRDSSPSRAAGARSADSHQRPDAEGPEARRDGQEEDGGGARGGTGGGSAEKGGSVRHGRRSETSTTEEGRKEARAARGAHRYRAHPGDVQQHDRHAYRS